MSDHKFIYSPRIVSRNVDESLLRVRWSGLKRLNRYYPEGADFVHDDLQIEDSGSQATRSFTDDESEKA